MMMKMRTIIPFFSSDNLPDPAMRRQMPIFQELRRLEISPTYCAHWDGQAFER